METRKDSSVLSNLLLTNLDGGEVIRFPEDGPNGDLWLVLEDNQIDIDPCFGSVVCLEDGSIYSPPEPKHVVLVTGYFQEGE